MSLEEERRRLLQLVGDAIDASRFPLLPEAELYEAEKLREEETPTQR